MRNGLDQTNFYLNNLVSTVDKKYLLKILREWRKEATSGIEVEVFADVIELVESGDVDG